MTVWRHLLTSKSGGGTQSPPKGRITQYKYKSISAAAPTYCTYKISNVCVCLLTFQRLIDVVVHVVDSQTVLEAGWVFLDPISHHIDRYITVVLLHLTQHRSDVNVIARSQILVTTTTKRASETLPVSPSWGLFSAPRAQQAWGTWSTWCRSCVGPLASLCRCTCRHGAYYRSIT